MATRSSRRSRPCSGGRGPVREYRAAARAFNEFIAIATYARAADRPLPPLEPTMTTQPEDGLEEHIQQEFVEEARDVLNELDVTVGNVRSHATSAESALGQLRRHCHNLLAGSRAVSLPTVEMVVHRLGVYGQPDMLICSAVLDELSGIDLACALSAMPVTAKIPLALLTSFEWGHPSLEQLPSRVAILRVGTHFGDDLAEALSRFSIT